jgi:uncharacterized protein HemX
MSRLAIALVMAVFALGAATSAFACGMNKTTTQASSAIVAQTDTTTTKTTTTVKPEGDTGG